MTPTEVADGIREYTGISEAKYNVDTIIESKYMLSDIVAYAMGFIFVLISTVAILLTALDVCYITIPPFQSKVRNERWDGSEGGSKFRIITAAARIAVEKADITGQNPLGIYLKKRVVAYLVWGMLLVVSVGGLQDFTRVAVGITQEIVSGFSTSYNRNTSKEESLIVTPEPTDLPQ